MEQNKQINYDYVRRYYYQSDLRVLLFDGPRLKLAQFTNLLLPFIVKVTRPSASVPYTPNVPFIKLFTLGFFLDKPFRYVIDLLVTQNYFQQFHLLPDQKTYDYIYGNVNALVHSRGSLFAVVVFKNEENKIGYMLVAERRASLNYFHPQVCMQLPNQDYVYFCHPKTVKISIFDQNPILELV
ncbi:hypothetical protein D1Q00_gp111 [Trichoplusia ni granulovirus LBIV-12]|uniref:Uncharacterized protein n=2 Tax=Betabaculovirus TaxID=558017 RepID=A0A1D8QLB5_GVTN|nr:hypothetical protein PsunGV_gp121 [Pseudalatia unipuncta granulovirus]YP_009506181.1 hypothetical protein D1Q00_gp111 [Trichoplusia ni granulovirus LBIV-12]ACH69471.1 unknown [Pseudalatia unipuncta granulovirus]AOW41449.1 hypothetical protein [Trichoplusia ni granulovirus LBIV-12]